ncbi:hypothetical protein D5F01_LYC20171 [Larimichthys crocea]|uniref:Interferon gamma n=1 Tax=Larimichthys crocea TaxID=215358 RepID=A0A0A7MBM9_LARCR|nr:interferon gamma [Larimichthys crocea]AIZ77177.1 interferon gamma [Larimichthys crocea]KAE8281197.1 hypothetical protein D5F01_LYC20171 [Larimichthys crocea]
MVAIVRAVVCLSLWLAVCQVRGFTIPAEMNRTIQSILDHYNVRTRLIFDGKPVIPKEMMPEHLEAKKTVMGGVLNMYEKLINQMLKGLSTPSPPTTGSTETASDPQVESNGEVRKELNYILSKIKDLKKYRYKDQEPEKVLEGLHRLKHIQMNDSVVQSKALWELSGIYEEASSLSNSTRKEKQRRRRQARKANRNHLRG